MLSEVAAVNHVSPHDRCALFRLFERCYQHVSWPQFQADLEEKDAVIVLRDTSGAPRGFSTQKVMRVKVSGVWIRAIFSGDTIIDPAHWGEQELGRAWCRYAGQVRASDPQSPLYWFLISKGYRTYLYLPVFFKRYYPACAWPTPLAEQDILDALAKAKFSNYYSPTTGLISFPAPRGNLKPELAVIPPHRMQNQHVRLFLSRNPEYARGTELACLAEISPKNMRSYPARMLKEEELELSVPLAESVHA